MLVSRNAIYEYAAMSIVETIKTVEGRPGMFLPEESSRYMSAFLSGYFFACGEESRCSQIYRKFQKWVQNKYELNTTHSVEAITIYCSGSDKQSLVLFFKLWNEFCSENEYSQQG